MITTGAVPDAYEQASQEVTALLQQGNAEMHSRGFNDLYAELLDIRRNAADAQASVSDTNAAIDFDSYALSSNKEAKYGEFWVDPAYESAKDADSSAAEDLIKADALLRARFWDSKLSIKAAEMKALNEKSLEGAAKQLEEEAAAEEEPAAREAMEIEAARKMAAAQLSREAAAWAADDVKRAVKLPLRSFSKEAAEEAVRQAAQKNLSTLPPNTKAAEHTITEPYSIFTHQLTSPSAHTPAQTLRLTPGSYSIHRSV